MSLEQIASILKKLHIYSGGGGSGGAGILTEERHARLTRELVERRAAEARVPEDGGQELAVGGREAEEYERRFRQLREAQGGGQIVRTGRGRALA